MNIWQENQLGKLAKKVTKRLYQSLGINLGSTFVIHTENCIMKMMFVIARSRKCTGGYDEPKQA